MAVVIETPRLTLRHHEYHDIGELVRIFASPKVTQFYRVGQTSEYIRDKLVRQISTREDIGEEKPYFGIWAIYHKEDGKCIGECGLRFVRVDGLTEEIIIETAVSFSYWGQNLALEAVSATRDYCFFELGIERLAAVISPSNKASIKLAHALCMEYERETESGFCLYAVETRCWLTDTRSKYFEKLEATLADRLQVVQT